MYLFDLIQNNSKSPMSIFCSIILCDLLSVATVIRIAGGLVGTLLFLAALVGVAPESVVELLLVAVEAGVGPGQAVHLPGHTILHVSLAVEVWHVPAVLLVIVVVGVGAVVAGGDALSVGCGGSVVEVVSPSVSHLGPGSQSHLLLLLGSGGPH